MSSRWTDVAWTGRLPAASTPVACLPTGGRQIGPKVPQFRDAGGAGNDTLVLRGDVLDFSIADYGEAYAAARVFLLRVRHDNPAAQAVFVPGNHDFTFRHIAPHEAAVERYGDMDDLVGINFPLTELAGSGIGPAGPLTTLVRAEHQEVQAGDLRRMVLDGVRLHRNRVHPLPLGHPVLAV